MPNNYGRDHTMGTHSGTSEQLSKSLTFSQKNLMQPLFGARSEAAEEQPEVVVEKAAVKKTETTLTAKSFEDRLEETLEKSFGKGDQK